MLAVLAAMGLTNIHRMNGLKNLGALCINAVTALIARLVASSIGHSRNIADGDRRRNRRLRRRAWLAQRVAQIWVRPARFQQLVSPHSCIVC